MMCWGVPRIIEREHEMEGNEKRPSASKELFPH